MEFPRQPESITITVNSTSDEDKHAAATQIQRFLEGRYASIDRINPPIGPIIIRAYPFAVND